MNALPLSVKLLVVYTQDKKILYFAQSCTHII